MHGDNFTFCPLSFINTYEMTEWISTQAAEYMLLFVTRLYQMNLMFVDPCIIA